MGKNKSRWKSKAAMAVGLGVPLSAIAIANPATAQPESAEAADYETSRENRERSSEPTEPVDTGGDGDRDRENDNRTTPATTAPSTVVTVDAPDLDFGGGLDFGTNDTVQSDDILEPNFDILADPAPEPENFVELSSPDDFDQDGIDRGGDGDRDRDNNGDTQQDETVDRDEINQLGVTLLGRLVPPDTDQAQPDTPGEQSDDPFDRQLHDLDFGGGLDFGTNAIPQSDNITEPNFDLLADPAPQPDNFVELSSADGFDQDEIDRGGDGDRDRGNNDDTQQDETVDSEEINQLVITLLGRLVPPDADQTQPDVFTDREVRLERALSRPARLGMRPMRGSPEGIQLQIAADNPNLPQGDDNNVDTDDNDSDPDEVSDQEQSGELTEKEQMELRRPSRRQIGF